MRATPRGRRVIVAALAALLTLGIITAARGGVPVGAAGSDGTISIADSPQQAPNYIFPFMGCSYWTPVNVSLFQWLMFRPLYWFGLGESSANVPSLSMARSPIFSKANHVVTLEMKDWKFADGQTVNAQSVMFFLNLFKAEPTAYCGYNPGYGIPDQVKTVRAAGDRVTITFTGSVNPNWILYNYLSQIIPLPDSWDRSSASKVSGCATGAYGAPATDVMCKHVLGYLDAQSQKTRTYTGTLWQSGVDGPWRLTSFDESGNATFQANPRYSGPQHAQVAKLKLVSFTSVESEMLALQGGHVDIGYVDVNQLTSSAPAPGLTGANWAPIASRYRIVDGPEWAINYWLFNFSKSDPKAAAIAQLYIRQALQMAVDQNGIIKKVYKGYGFPGYSPLPPSTPAALGGPVSNPYPFDLAGAKALLVSHGWKMTNGVMSCVRAGTGPRNCGAGIDPGYRLNLKMILPIGSAGVALATQIADWGAIGVHVVYITGSFSTIQKDCGTGSGFEICSFGGWIYSPDYYPSGESLFASGGGFNVGHYSDARMDELIRQTTFGRANLTAFASFAAHQLPVLYQPAEAQPVEVVKTLKSSIGFTPNPFGNFTPEYYHY